jgi:hypothetical protein
MLRRLAVTACVSIWSSSALAWWDEGHMRIAAMAYELLTPTARAEANRLIRFNPRYEEWKAAVPPNPDGTPGDAYRQTFIRASVWADDIKTYKDYRDASTRDGSDTSTAGQNIGYSDKLIHGYWHYKDIGFSTDGTPIEPADPVNAVTQIQLFTTALPASAGAGDDIRSYDLVWLLHLVGDVHQPLHSTALFAREFSLKHQLGNDLDTGDRGGNEISVSPATGEVVNRHAYWDGIFGGYSTVTGAIFDGFTNSKDSKGRWIPKVLWAIPPRTEVSDPNKWIEESHELALKYAYAEPVASGRNAIELTREYETNARKLAEEQIAIAAARLANLINKAFDPGP